jgi:hypothetical protein
MHGHVPSGFGRRQPHGEPVMVPFPLLRAKGRENLYIYKWGQIFTRCNASEMQGILATAQNSERSKLCQSSNSGRLRTLFGSWLESDEVHHSIDMLSCSQVSSESFTLE